MRDTPEASMFDCRWMRYGHEAVEDGERARHRYKTTLARGWHGGPGFPLFPLFPLFGIAPGSRSRRRARPGPRCREPPGRSDLRMKAPTDRGGGIRHGR